HLQIRLCSFLTSLLTLASLLWLSDFYFISSKMSKLQLLNVFLTKRLTAAAVEIYVEVEKTITEYENEISSSKEEIKRLRRLLDLVFNPEIKLHRADLHQLYLPDEVSPEQQHCEQEWSPSLKQEDPEPSQIKKEHEELWTSQGGEQLKELEPDPKEFIFTPSSVESQEPPQPSHLFQMQIVGSPTTTTKEIKMKICHIGENPSCHVCGKCFDCKSGLERHMRAHTGEKPYCCSECGKCYSQIGNLTVHMRGHTGERSYRCFLCREYFITASQLKSHKTTHAQGRNIIPATPKTKSYLCAGNSREAWEGPYRCKECGKSFRQKRNLLRHMRNHTGAIHAANASTGVENFFIT
ncbi:hypothetical protein J4Q44_G00068440, partial [Coregonus suidteri]